MVGRVTGTVVATAKHESLIGQKILIVTPEATDGRRGPEILAIDGVGAGVGELVLVVLEGRSAGDVLGSVRAPVDAAIVGVVDHLTIDDG